MNSWSGHAAPEPAAFSSTRTGGAYRGAVTDSAGGAAARLASLVRIPTIAGPDRDEERFEAFRAALRELYPLVHSRLDLRRVGVAGLLYRWAGGPAAPIVLMAHQDVVPAEPAAWRFDPFAGRIEGGRVIGRGTLDDKGPLVAVLEAVESLLAEEFVPAGDVWLSFGGDEERYGADAQAAVAALREAGVRPALVLDEGGAVVEGVFPRVPGPVAVVGVTEKGIATILMTAEGSGGHASTPAKGGATAVLAKAILTLERHPFPARTGPVVPAMVEALAPRLPPRLARALRSAAGRAAVGPLLGRAGGVAGAIVRTTVAVTELRGSAAPNVLATQATATLNVRIVPGDTVVGVLDRLARTVRDPRVRFELVQGSGPAAVSPTEGPAFERIRGALAVSHPEALLVPYVMVQASDARWFTAIADHVYRFMPFRIAADQLASIHGENESVDVAALEAGIAFHRALLTGA